MDLVFQLKEASVADVLERLPDPPSYSSVRTMMRLLEGKGFLKHRNEANRYIYRPTQKKETARMSALQHLIRTFFEGSASETVAAILGNNSKKLSDEDLDRIQSLIDQAREEGR